MKRLLSTKYSASAFNIAMLILRIGMGGLMMPHGFDKLVHYGSYREKFMNFLGMGSSLSLALVIFSEFFCSIFLIVGLFSRIIVIPMIIGVCVVIFKAHDGEIFGDGEHGALFLTGFLVIFLVGPGRISADGLMGK